MIGSGTRCIGYDRNSLAYFFLLNHPVLLVDLYILSRGSSAMKLWVASIHSLLSLLPIDLKKKIINIKENSK